MNQRRRAHGMTLPELLVALTLGLGVLLAAALLLAAANASYVAQTDALQVDDGGRYALGLIGRALRQGAYIDGEGAGAPAADKPAAIAGLDDRSLTKGGEHISSPSSAAAGHSDVLALRFPGAGTAPGGDGSVLDCAGFGVHAADEGWSIFYVARNSEGVAELRCKYRGSGGWGADAVVANVDSFQVLYGIDTDSPADGVPNRYVNATSLAALDAALPGAGAGGGASELNKRTWWKRVVSVQVALLLHGERAARAVALPREYLLFGPDYAAAHAADDPGARLVTADPPAEGPPLRRLFSAVFAVGAAAPATP